MSLTRHEPRSNTKSGVYFTIGSVPACSYHIRSALYHLTASFQRNEKISKNIFTIKPLPY